MVLLLLFLSGTTRSISLTGGDACVGAYVFGMSRRFSRSSEGTIRTYVALLHLLVEWPLDRCYLYVPRRENVEVEVEVVVAVKAEGVYM